MSKNKTKFEVSISKSVTVQLWGDLPICALGQYRTAMVVLSRYTAVPVNSLWHCVSIEFVWLYIMQKVEIFSGVTDPWQTDTLRGKCRANQLQRSRSGALVPRSHIRIYDLHDELQFTNSTIHSKMMSLPCQSSCSALLCSALLRRWNQKMTHWLSYGLTISPIELSWTAKKSTFLPKYFQVSKLRQIVISRQIWANMGSIFRHQRRQTVNSCNRSFKEIDANKIASSQSHVLCSVF